MLMMKASKPRSQQLKDPKLHFWSPALLTETSVVQKQHPGSICKLHATACTQTEHLVLLEDTGIMANDQVNCHFASTAVI